jgi:hypothetical protein
VPAERRKVRCGSCEDFDVANGQGRVGMVHGFIPDTAILRLVKHEPGLHTVKGGYAVMEMLHPVTIRL